MNPLTLNHSKPLNQNPKAAKPKTPKNPEPPPPLSVNPRPSVRGSFKGCLQSSFNLGAPLRGFKKPLKCEVGAELEGGKEVYRLERHLQKASWSELRITQTLCKPYITPISAP